MTIAVVTLKVTPNELQVISEALKMYAYANRHLTKEYAKHPLDGYQHDTSIGQNDPRRLVLAANKIRQDIGLK